VASSRIDREVDQQLVVATHTEPSEGPGGLQPLHGPPAVGAGGFELTARLGHIGAAALAEEVQVLGGPRGKATRE